MVDASPAVDSGAAPLDGRASVARIPQSYGPVRTGNSVMRAMRRDTELLDLGRMRLARSDLIRREPPGDDVLITEKVYLSETKKKRKKEVAEHALPASSSDQLKKAKLKEWDKIVKSGAIRIHVGDEARKMIQSSGSERLLQSRFVVTYPDDGEQHCAKVC